MHVHSVVRWKLLLQYQRGGEQVICKRFQPLQTFASFPRNFSAMSICEGQEPVPSLRAKQKAHYCDVIQHRQKGLQFP